MTLEEATFDWLVTLRFLSPVPLISYIPAINSLKFERELAHALPLASYFSFAMEYVLYENAIRVSKSVQVSLQYLIAPRMRRTLTAVTGARPPYVCFLMRASS